MSLFLSILFVITFLYSSFKSTSTLVTHGDLFITLAIYAVGFKIDEFMNIYKKEIKQKKRIKNIEEEEE